MAVQPEANGVNLGLAPGAAHPDGGPKIVPVLTPGKRKRIAYEITTVEEVRESAPISRPERTVMDSVTERLLSQPRDRVRIVPVLESDRNISGETAAQKLAGLSVPLFRIEDLHPSIDGSKPFEHHVETVFNSSVNGFARIARILEKHLVNNAERMPDSHAHTLQLREVITQLAGVADGTIQTTPPELAQFKRNVHVFAQDVVARQRAGAYVDPIELQMYEAAEQAFNANRQLEVLREVARISGFDKFIPDQKDATWRLALLEGGITEQVQQYASLARQSHEAATPIQRATAGTIAHLWEGLVATRAALSELPALSDSHIAEITAVSAVMKKTLSTLSSTSNSESAPKTIERLNKRVASIRQEGQADPSLAPVADRVIAGIEIFLEGLNRYQRLESIIAQPNAHELTQGNLERVITLEQFIAENPQDVEALRIYTWRIGAPGAFAYMISPVKGFTTETAYLRAQIRSHLDAHASQEEAAVSRWEARQIVNTPLVPGWKLAADGWHVNAQDDYQEARERASALAQQAREYKRAQALAAQEAAEAVEISDIQGADTATVTPAAIPAVVDVSADIQTVLTSTPPSPRRRWQPLNLKAALHRLFLGSSSSTAPERIPHTLPPRGSGRRAQEGDVTEQIINGRVFRDAQPWRWQTTGDNRP